MGVESMLCGVVIVAEFIWYGGISEVMWFCEVVVRVEMQGG